MDFSTIFVSLLVLGAFLVPPVYIYFKRKNRTKKFQDMMNKLAESQSCKVSEYDQWKKSCVGLDKNNHKLFYLKQNSKKIHSEITNLNEILKCKITGINASSNGSAQNNGSIEKLDLCLTYKDNNKENYLINFFDAEKDFIVDDDDIKLTEKWNKLINSELKLS
jgi:hypothetical protein